MRCIRLIVLLLVLPAAGWKCSTAPERPVIPQVVEVPVPTPVALDPKLTADCMNERARSQQKGEAVRLANVRDDYLDECTKRMRRIRALQPKKEN